MLLLSLTPPHSYIKLETFDPGQSLWSIHFVYIPYVALCLLESESLLNKIELKQSFK